MERSMPDQAINHALQNLPAEHETTLFCVHAFDLDKGARRIYSLLVFATSKKRAGLYAMQFDNRTAIAPRIVYGEAEKFSIGVGTVMAILNGDLDCNELATTFEFYKFKQGEQP